jgi:hypothetical protein
MRLVGSDAYGVVCVTDHFRLRLPTGWVAAHGHTHHHFVNEHDGESVRVTVQEIRSDLDARGLVRAAIYAAEAWRAAAEARSKVSLSFGYLEPVAVEEGFDVVFPVAESKAQVQHHVWILARPCRIVTLEFTRRVPLLGSNDYEVKAARIRAALQVEGAGGPRRRPTRS